MYFFRFRNYSVFISNKDKYSVLSLKINRKIIIKFVFFDVVVTNELADPCATMYT